MEEVRCLCFNLLAKTFKNIAVLSTFHIWEMHEEVTTEKDDINKALCQECYQEGCKLERSYKTEDLQRKLNYSLMNSIKSNS